MGRRVQILMKLALVVGLLALMSTAPWVLVTEITSEYPPTGRQLMESPGLLAWCVMLAIVLVLWCATGLHRMVLRSRWWLAMSAVFVVGVPVAFFPGFILLGPQIGLWFYFPILLGITFGAPLAGGLLLATLIEAIRPPESPSRHFAMRVALIVTSFAFWPTAMVVLLYWAWISKVFGMSRG